MLLKLTVIFLSNNSGDKRRLPTCKSIVLYNKECPFNSLLINPKETIKLTIPYLQ